MKQTALTVLAFAVLTSILSNWTVLGQTSLTVVSAADYNSAYGSVAPGSIVSMFAANIATGTFFAENLPLPTSLGGVSATISDSTTNTLPIQLIAVTPLQVNAVLPSGFFGHDCQSDHQQRPTDQRCDFDGSDSIIIVHRRRIGETGSRPRRY